MRLLRASVFLVFLLMIACQRRAPPSPPAASSAPPAAAHSMSEMPQLPATLADWARGAQLFAGLGDFHRRVSTTSPQAQQYFDQGMRLMWAFNHDESSRSFAKAAELDPGCAICLWGVALTVGPNYNMPMMAEPRAKVAFESLQRAMELLDKATAPEQALVRALRSRYPTPKALDPSNLGPVLQAYANEMRSVAERFPEDSDIQTMYAEALMNTNAWKLWSRDGAAAPGTDTIVATLEAVLARDPGHPGANHYYIHAIEASPQPQKALAAADRLGGMMPAAGHLVHMPAHIMQRVGRYSDAAQANRKASVADDAYLQKSRPIDYYPMYVAHNYQFLAYATAMEGRKAETLEAMKRMREVFPEEAMLSMPGTDWYGAEPYMAFVRFGMWDEILAERKPNPALKALTGGYLFARVSALSAKGRAAEARLSLDELDKLRATVPPESPAGVNTATDVLALASRIARSRVEAAENNRDAAIQTLTEAVALEDRLGYNEPADWFFPVRHLLGAELLEAGRGAQAEAVYREDLRRNPQNGWSLLGLSQALRLTGKAGEAGEAEQRFKQAWKDSDVSLRSSMM